MKMGLREKIRICLESNPRWSIQDLSEITGATSSRVREVLGHKKGRAYSRPSGLTRRTIKQKLCEEYGDQCLLCFYRKTMKGLQFHHLIKEEKVIEISQCTNYAQAKKEATKCLLVCGNCHGEIEEGITSIPQEYMDYYSICGDTTDIHRFLKEMGKEKLHLLLKEFLYTHKRIGVWELWNSWKRTLKPA